MANGLQVEELRGKWERSRRGQQLAELAAAQQAAALRQLELRLAQLSSEKEACYCNGYRWVCVWWAHGIAAFDGDLARLQNMEQAFDHASDRLQSQEIELNELRHR